MVASKIRRFFKGKPASEKAPTPARIDLRPEQIAALEAAIGYRFRDKALLARSMTHPSFLLNSKSQIRNNQRLEFLGDSVIQLALTEALFKKFPRQREGKLTALRAGYARGEYMAVIALRLGLGDFLILKPKDREAGIAENDSALGDAFEALVGAIYLDSDWETARTLILQFYEGLEAHPTEPGAIANPKGTLQEMIQPVHGNNAIRYETLSTSGDPHDRVFHVAVFCKDERIGEGSGRAKKEAAEKAALQAIGHLKASE